jgi:hypothetical protein
LLKSDGVTKLSLYFEIRPSPSQYIITFARYGDHIDYDNNRLGKQLLVRPTINWSVGRSLQFKLRHSYQNLDVQSPPLFTALQITALQIHLIFVPAISSINVNLLI